METESSTTNTPRVRELELDHYSLEEVVRLKVRKFLEQVESFYPNNFHEVIMSKVEKPLIAEVMRRCGGNQVQAARILGINRNTLRKKISDYNI